MKEATTEPRDPSKPLSNPRWEKVLNAFFKSFPQIELSAVCAKVGGYKKGRASENQASRMMKDGAFAARLKLLQERAVDDTVMSVLERKQMLTRTARETEAAKMCDYMHAGGDGAYISYGPDSPNQGAVQELTTFTQQDDNGDGCTITSKIKLQPKTLMVACIRELNEMEGAHAPAKVAQTDTKGNDVTPWFYAPPPPKDMAAWAKWHADYEKAAEKAKQAK